MTCPGCGLAGLPAEARFCARCGRPLQKTRSHRRASAAPVWLLVLLWVGAGLLAWVTALYAALGLGVVTPSELGVAAGGTDTAALQGTALLIAACAGSVGVAHVAAAVGLMGHRPWARPFATMVCVVWALTCVGLPVGLLGINALWRGSVNSAGASLPR